MDFLLTVIGAGSWHKNLLAHGLTFRWKNLPPPPYREPNNRSALDNMDRLRAQVAEWETGGYVERLTAQPYCCNPLTVAIQVNSVTQIVKYRPCIDLSRHVNLYIAGSHMKLDDLAIAQELIDHGDFMAAFDLENQFFQVRLAPETRKYFGFMIPSVSGEDYFYQFTVMAYGCKPAVYIVTRLLLPIKAFLNRLGIKMSVYVDDGRISASSYETCRSQFYFALHVLQLAGWRIQWKKTTIHPTRSLLHLGFITDSARMTYSITESKKTGVLLTIDSVLLLAHHHQNIPIKLLATLLGKLTALRRSHGPAIHALSRHLQHQLGLHVHHIGWTGGVPLTAESFQELKTLVSDLDFFDHRILLSRTATVQVVNHPARLALMDRLSTGESVPRQPVGALSFVLQLDGSMRQILDFPAQFVSGSESDILKELLAATTALTDVQGTTVSPIILHWQTDSSPFIHTFLHGSRVTILNKAVLLIRWLERTLSVDFRPVWTPPSPADINYASAKFDLNQSTDEWCIHREDLAAVFAALTFFPDIDCFASHTNAICERFFSRSPQLHSAGVNFFSQLLNPSLRYFCCPPVRLLPAVLQHLVKFPGARVLVVLPVWHSAVFWPLFHPNGHPHRFVTATHSFVPRFFTSNGVPCHFTSANAVHMLAMLFVIPVL